MGFAHLKVELKHGFPPAVPFRTFNLGDAAWPTDLQRLSATRIFIFGCRFDFPYDSPKWKGLYINAAGPVLIAKNQWKGNAPAWSHGIKRYLACRDNTFDFANEQVSLSSDRMIFENNVMTGHIVPGVTTSLHGLFTKSWVGYAVWNKYVARNTCRTMNYVPGNDGEAFALDSPGFFMFGDVRAATDRTVEFREDAAATEGSVGWHLEWQAVIVKGRGLGQLRKVAAHEALEGSPKAHRVTVHPPWDIPPDATSKVAIARPHVGTVFEENTATDCCGPATQFYHCVYDCVASGTVGTNTQGVINYGAFWGEPGKPATHRAMMAYFTKVRGCTVSGASARFKNTWMGERGEDHLASAPCFAVSHYGSEYRQNVVDRRGCEDAQDYDNRNPGGFSANTQNTNTAGRCILAPLFEGNTVRNSKLGYALGCPGCTGALISRPTQVGVGTPVLDKGTRTVVLTDGAPAAGAK